MNFTENKNPPTTVQPSIEANEFSKIMRKLAKVELTNELFVKTSEKIKAI